MIDADRLHKIGDELWAAAKVIGSVPRGYEYPELARLLKGFSSDLHEVAARMGAQLAPVRAVNADKKVQT